MNSAFVGYEELSRWQRVLSTLVSVDNTLLDMLNSSYPTQPHSLIAKYNFSFLFFSFFFEDETNDMRMRSNFILSYFINFVAFLKFYYTRRN